MKTCDRRFAWVLGCATVLGLVLVGTAQVGTAQEPASKPQEPRARTAQEQARARAHDRGMAGKPKITQTGGLRIWAEPGHPKPGGVDYAAFIEAEVCAADAVVRATPVGRRSMLNASETFIFTDHRLRIHEVIRGEPRSDSSTMLVSTLGGSVVVDGRTLSAAIQPLKEISLQDEYVFFLDPMPGAGAFKLSSRLSFVKNEGGRAVFAPIAHWSPMAFVESPREFAQVVTDIRSAAAKCSPAGAPSGDTSAGDLEALLCTTSRLHDVPGTRLRLKGEPFHARILSRFRPVDRSNKRYRFLGLASILVTALSCASASGPTDQGGSLATAAAKAKAEGKRSTTMKVISGSAGTRDSLAEVVSSLSALVVEVTDINRAVVHTAHFIYTWQLLRLESAISSRPKLPMLCDGPNPPFAVPRGELALANPSGTAVIDGVSVTMTSDASLELKVGGRYLLFATYCSEDVDVPPDGANGFYEIGSDGRLIVGPDQEVPFAAELAQLGTLEGFRNYLTRN